MTTVVSLRLSEQVLALIERFAAQQSLTRGDAIKAMIFAHLQAENENKKMLANLKTMEVALMKKLDSLAQPQVTKTETNFDQSQAVVEVKKLQKVFDAMLLHFVLPNADGDHRPSLNAARKLLSE